MSKFHNLIISEIIKETPNSVTIEFDVPQNLKDNFSFKAGQYITIRKEINGEEVRRAYSICSSTQSGILRVGVKKVENGTFSVLANEELKAGDSLEVMEPEGHFTIEAESSKNYIAFAAGSGITPVLSIIQEVLHSNDSSKFVLVYGNKTKSESMFYDELNALAEVFPNRFFIEYIFSRKEEENARFGRIDKSLVNYFLKNKHAKTVFHEYYLCGPESMIDEVSAVLKSQGVNEKQIHFELFTTAEEGLLIESHDGNTSITVTVDNETESFVMSQQSSVLQAVLDHGLDAPYSCQGGICSTCIARITEGKAEMRKNQILTDGEIAEGLILTCQAHPTTPTLIVDYDDV